MNVTIRDMTAGDADEVCALVQANYDGAIAACHSPEEVARLRAVVTPAWVAAASGAASSSPLMKGRASSRPLPSPTSAPLRRVATVCASASSAPIVTCAASALGFMGEVCAAARDAGAPRLHVPSSRNAVAFYERLGFLIDAGQPEAGDETTRCPWRCEAPAEQAHEPDAPEAGSRLMGSGAQVMCRTLAVAVRKGGAR